MIPLEVFGYGTWQDIHKPKKNISIAACHVSVSDLFCKSTLFVFVRQFLNDKELSHEDVNGFKKTNKQMKKKKKKKIKKDKNTEDHCHLSIGRLLNFIFNLFFYAGLFKGYWYYLRLQGTFSECYKWFELCSEQLTRTFLFYVSQHVFYC